MAKFNIKHHPTIKKKFLSSGKFLREKKYIYIFNLFACRCISAMPLAFRVSNNALQKYFENFYPFWQALKQKKKILSLLHLKIQGDHKRVHFETSVI